MVCHKGDTNASHTGRRGGFDPCHSIFQNQTVGWFNPQTAGTFKKYLGVGFATAGIFHAYTGTQHIAYSGELKDQLEVSPGSTGTYGLKCPFLRQACH
jgi:hypothetical protein